MWSICLDLPNHRIPAGSFWRQTAPTGQKGSAGERREQAEKVLTGATGICAWKECRRSSRGPPPSARLGPVACILICDSPQLASSSARPCGARPSTARIAAWFPWQQRLLGPWRAIATRPSAIFFKTPKRSGECEDQIEDSHSAHDPNVSSKALASFKSSVSKPSVNQP
jgi:hypothetical protein